MSGEVDIATRRLRLKIALEELRSIGFDAKRIKINSDCSFCKKNDYYSYRRDGEKTGRMIGVITSEV